MKVKIKINVIFHFIILGGLGQKGLSFFLLAFLELSLKMVTNMKLAFTIVLFKWFRLKRVISQIWISHIS